MPGGNGSTDLRAQFFCIFKILQQTNGSEFWLKKLGKCLGGLVEFIQVENIKKGAPRRAWAFRAQSCFAVRWMLPGWKVANWADIDYTPNQAWATTGTRAKGGHASSFWLAREREAFYEI